MLATAKQMQPTDRIMVNRDCPQVNFSVGGITNHRARTYVMVHRTDRYQVTVINIGVMYWNTIAYVMDIPSAPIMASTKDL